MAIPQPATGLVVSYDYLWKDQARGGETSGRKTRPCAVIITIRDADNELRVFVAPITHSDPQDPTAVPLPLAVKRRLGLDDQPSWIVTTELNDFVWPGFDLRPVARDKPEVFAWGYLPVELVAAVRDGIARNRTDRRLGLVNRD